MICRISHDLLLFFWSVGWASCQTPNQKYFCTLHPSNFLAQVGWSVRHLCLFPLALACLLCLLPSSPLPSPSSLFLLPNTNHQPLASPGETLRRQKVPSARCYFFLSTLISCFPWTCFIFDPEKLLTAEFPDSQPTSRQPRCPPTALFALFARAGPPTLFLSVKVIMDDLNNDECSREHCALFVGECVAPGSFGCPVAP